MVAGMMRIPEGELADDVGFIDGLVVSLKSDFPRMLDITTCLTSLSARCYG